MLSSTLRLIRLSVASKEWLNNKILRVYFNAVEPKDITFEPGQHVSFKINDTARPYSIASDPNNTKGFFIIISAGHDGVGANFLKGLKDGDSVEGVGPYGKFVLSKDLSKNIVMIATGTGVSPIYSMLQGLAAKGVKNNIKLYFGLEAEADRFLIEELDALKEKLEEFDYELCLSAPSKSWKGNRGRVGKFVKIDAPNETQVYICGHRNMVKEMAERVMELGVSEEDVYF